MTGRGKDIDGEDDALWAAAMGDVAPLKKPARMIAGAPPPPKASSSSSKTGRIPATIMPAASVAPPIGREIDKRTRQRLERGKMDIEAMLDLHGHARDSARAVLVTFLLEAYNADRRCVLVITGKGKSGTGILKASFADWVNEPPLSGIILETSPARANHGGRGAFYVLLRRRRG
jgi:DNA-nicking Smr family endonuclease